METTSTTRNAVIAALVLAIIGAVNWLLVGLFRFNLVSAIFGDMSTLSRIVYVLVGLSGLYLNLRGRESCGTVAPGAEAEALKRELMAKLSGLP